MDSLASITLNFGAIVLAAALTAITWVSVSADLNTTSIGNTQDGIFVQVAFAIISWFLAAALLVFIASILLNIIDAACAHAPHAEHRPAVFELPSPDRQWRCAVRECTLADACLVIDLDNAQQTGTYRQPAIAEARISHCAPCDLPPG